MVTVILPLVVQASCFSGSKWSCCVHTERVNGVKNVLTPASWTHIQLEGVGREGVGVFNKLSI